MHSTTHPNFDGVRKIDSLCTKKKKKENVEDDLEIRCHTAPSGYFGKREEALFL